MSATQCAYASAAERLLRRQGDRSVSRITILFPAPAKLLSANDRDHWRKRAELVRYWRQRTHLAARHLGPQPPSVVHLTLPVRDRRRRDPMNYYPTLKAVVDGLVDAGCWPDDTPDYVRTVEPVLDPDADVVMIRLEPMEANR